MANGFLNTSCNFLKNNHIYYYDMVLFVKKHPWYKSATKGEKYLFKRRLWWLTASFFAFFYATSAGASNFTTEQLIEIDELLRNTNLKIGVSGILFG